MKVLFLDRDGVINCDIGYLHEINKAKFVDGIFEFCKYFQDKGFKLIIVTNQSGIGRNYFSEEDFKILSNWMLRKFLEKGIHILDIFYCPHAPEDNCNCRKPKSGLFIDAIRKFQIEIDQSWSIGDNERDITASISAGVKKNILLSNKNHPDTQAMYVLKSLKKINNIF